ncbi:MAG: Txe/YoeB family addiction module toxin [Bacteroidales bacterium]|jgi:toxin YoeB|nr:Txe/YoeB family addiction module toxin [Bacteroidales bacterium]MBO7598171.1 Txe/YoeB family addiction module toxin [Bacteroidales bacterium]
MYEVEFTSDARKGLAKLEKSEPKLFAKVATFVEELKEHPTTGTGHPEPLKGQPEGRWSRRISQKHRLVYRIFDTEVLVLVLSAYGHYDDK